MYLIHSNPINSSLLAKLPYKISLKSFAKRISKFLFNGLIRFYDFNLLTKNIAYWSMKSRRSKNGNIPVPPAKIT